MASMSFLAIKNASLYDSNATESLIAMIKPMRGIVVSLQCTFYVTHQIPMSRAQTQCDLFVHFDPRKWKT